VAQSRARKNKTKGLNLQNAVVSQIYKTFGYALGENDVRSQPMNLSGEDIILSPQARRIVPFSIECKNTESLDFWGAVDQAVMNCAGFEPMVVAKKNNRKPFVAVPMDVFFTLLWGLNATECNDRIGVASRGGITRDLLPFLKQHFDNQPNDADRDRSSRHNEDENNGQGDW
jgi:hypothetical protein